MVPKSLEWSFATSCWSIYIAWLDTIDSTVEWRPAVFSNLPINAGWRSRANFTIFKVLRRDVFTKWILFNKNFISNPFVLKCLWKILNCINKIGMAFQSNTIFKALPQDIFTKWILFYKNFILNPFVMKCLWKNCELQMFVCV